MKSYLLVPVALLLFTCSSTTTNSESEMASIKAAIELETSSFYKVDKPNWEGSWVQEPYAYWSYSDSTGTSFLEGWETIQNNFEGYFSTQIPNRNIDVAHAEDDLIIEREYKEFRVYGNGAYVQYTQRVKDSQIARDETSQIRIMEKLNGKWLVAYVGIIARYPE